LRIVCKTLYSKLEEFASSVSDNCWGSDLHAFGLRADGSAVPPVRVEFGPGSRMK
jgi:hypothetical protein